MSAVTALVLVVTAGAALVLGSGPAAAQTGPGSTSTSSSTDDSTPAILPGFDPADPDLVPEPSTVDGDQGDDPGEGVGWPVVVGVGAGALVIGAVAGRVGRDRGPKPFDVAPTAAPAVSVPSSTTTPSPDSTHGPDPAVERAAAERDRLVGALIEMGDEARSESARALVVQRLGEVGVEPVVVSPGDRFDPTAHRGVHAEPATGPEQADTVAALERPGWVDRGRVIRPPDVVVRRWDRGES